MKGKIILVLLVLTVTFVVIWGQSASVNEYTETVEKTDIIIVGKLKEVLPIVDIEKYQVSGANSLPNPNEYIVGHEYLLEVSEWIKAKPEIRKKGEVRIFIEGRIPKEGEANLIKGKEYLLFLNYLKKNNSKNAVVLRLKSNDLPNESKFNSEDYLTIYGGQTGAISDKDKIKEVSNKIKNLF